MAFHFLSSKRRKRSVSRRGLSTTHLNRRRLNIEKLEDRQLLSANEIISNGEAIGVEPTLALTAAIGVSPTIADIVGDDLVINDGAGGNNQYSLSVDAIGVISLTDLSGGAIGLGSITGTGTESNSVTIDPGQFTGEILINGLSGDDSLIVDFSGGGSFPAIVFHGGANVSSDPGDQLTLTGGMFAAATYNFDNANDGSIDLDGQMITYSGLEPITSTINAAEVTLNYSTANETITVTAAGSGSTTVNSNAGEIVTFVNPTSSLTINAGDTGDDVINLDGLATDYTANIIIEGGTGNDTVNVNGPVSLDNKNLTITADTIDVNAAISTSGGNVSLTSTGDITLFDSVTTAGGGFDGVADSDNDGSGTFSLAAFLIQQPKLTASDPGQNYKFGESVSIDGDTAIVGVVGDGSGAGSSYVFTLSSGQWTQQQKLTASDAAAGDGFGNSVSVSGNTIIVGARLDDDFGASSGSAYIFTRSSGLWTEQGKLTASDGAAFDLFGESVSVTGDTVIVGSRSHDGAGSQSGAVYVFTRNSGIWTLQQKLTAFDATASEQFGGSVSVSGNTIIVGAQGDDDFGSASGSVYIFIRNSGIWTLQQKLTASDAAALDFFGTSVSVSGDSAIVGAKLADNTDVDSGSAYVFTRSSGVWTEQQKLTAFDATENDNFGGSVSLNGDTIVVGANFAGNGSGSAYVFTRSSGQWTWQQELSSSDIAPGDQFGNSVSVSGDTVFLGAHLDNDVEVNSGSAYIFQPLAGKPGGAISTDSGPILITANMVDIQGAIAGTGSLQLIPSQTASTIGLGGGLGDYNIDDIELAYLADGFSTIVIGDVTNGTVDIDSVTFADPVTISGSTINDNAGTDITAPSVTLSGNVSPGQSSGILSVAGDFTFAGGDTLTVDIGGTLPGSTPTNHDQLNATGSVDIGANVTLATIAVSGFVPAAGQHFEIINRTGGTGAFGGLPEGSILPNFLGSGLDFVISYAGGDGDDVVIADTTPLTVVSLSPLDTTSGTIPSGANSLDIQFSAAVLAAQLPTSYQLRGAGTDGLLGTVDDSVFPVTATVAASLASLSFSPLPDDVYRLTIFDSVTDQVNSPLDGDSDGTPGADFAIDFVAGALSTTLTSPNGFDFDIEYGGFGSGQIVQGASNAFDGVNRLRIDGAEFTPAISLLPIQLSTQEALSSAAQSLFSSFITPSGMPTLTVAASGVHQLSISLGLRHLTNSATQVEYRYRVNGVVRETRVANLPTSFSGRFTELNLDDVLNLNAGDAVQLQVREVFGAVELRTFSAVPQHRLRITRLDNVPSVTFQEALSTTVQSLFSSFITPSGMSTLSVAASGVHQLSVSLGLRHLTNSITQVEYRYLVNGVVGETRVANIPSFFSGRFSELNLDDVLNLNAGDAVELQVREVFGAVELRTFSAVPQHRLRLARYADVPSVTFQESLSTTAQSLSSSFIIPSGMPTLTVAASGVHQLSVSLGLRHLTNSATQVEYRYLVNGVVGETRVANLPTSFSFRFSELNLDDVLNLNTGDAVQLQVREVFGAVELRTFSAVPQHRLRLARYADVPGSVPTDDAGRTILDLGQSLAGLNISREITVPNTGGEDFARTVDVLHNPTGSTINTTVSLLGNLGADTNTTIVATSDGDLTIDTDDLWFATADSAGGPVTVHLFRNKHGIQPSTAGIVAGDNLQLDYLLSVNPGETVRLAHFTIMGNDLTAATAAANALLGSSTALGGEAGAFLTQAEIDSFANFVFHVPEVLDITLAGTNWVSGFLDAVDGGGSGAGNGLGYSLVGAHQLQTTPWAGADKLYVKFSTDVSSSLDAGDFTLLGTNGGTYAFSLLPYGQDGTNVATILLGQAVDIDSLVLSIDAAGVQNATGDLLDGEWTSGQAVSSGDGTAGGQFDFFFNVLPGDVDASDQVTVTDAFLAFASDTAATTELLARKDIDASGQITATDAFAAFAKNTFGLPAQPVPPAPSLAVLQASVVIDEALDQLANVEQLASLEIEEEADEDVVLAFPISLRGAYTPTARGRITPVTSSRIAYSSSEQESNALALATPRVTGHDDLDRNVSSYDEALSDFDSDEETEAVTVASSRSRSFAPAIRSRFSRT